MILHGLLKVVFNIILPLGLIYLLEIIGIMQFNDVFVIGIIAIGVVGVILSVLTHTFKKDTVAHGYTRIINAVYSALFTFYIFGGFTVGDGFGNYAISTSLAGFTVAARVGLQVIAYVSMIGAAFNVLQHISKTAELAKDKEYNITIKKKFRASKVFSIAGFVTSLLLVLYIVSIPVSAIQIKPSLIGDGFEFDHDDNGTPIDFTDDIIYMYIMFNINNGGAWSIFDVRLDVDLRVQNCIDSGSLLTLIPDGTRIGGSPDVVYNFLQFTSTTSENISISIEPAYVFDLINCSATLLFELSFEARYAQLTLDIDLTFPMEWSEII
jgi:hypothetical protein